MFKKILSSILILSTLLPFAHVSAQASFNPEFIISDNELQSSTVWTRDDVQKFLDSKGSYLSQYQAEDASGTVKLASDIIYEAGLRYQINPKYLLVTLQKEQSLITDDTPTQKQLDWATGYGVCDSCSMDDPKLQKYKGFGQQVDNSAGIMRWYYNNSDRGYIKKKDVPTTIDDQQITPQSWATAFLYTYTPHIHGNQNFWRIWTTWFNQNYPDGTLLQAASSTDVWLITNNKKRKFANKSALLSRADPKMIITVPEIELDNYEAGPDISFSNYSVLRSPNGTYLVDYDTIRPFDSDKTVGLLGFNPQEIIDVNAEDLNSFTIGPTITASSTPPQGVIYQISDMSNAYFILKDNTLSPIVDKRIIDVNFANLKIEKHTRAELSKYNIVSTPVQFKDGTLIQSQNSSIIFVIEKGVKRRIADQDTFDGFGYKKSNIVTTSDETLLGIPEGDPLFLNSSLLSADKKFLGDSEAKVEDYFKSTLPSYVVADFPSGRILSGKNIDTKRSIASITKLLTAYETLNQNFKKDSSTTYDPKKFSSPGNSLTLKTGEKIKNSDILNITLVGSYNNTARMLAQTSGLTEAALVSKINSHLAEWGADKTRLSDVTGLDEKNQSSARDLMKIFTKIISNPSLKTVLNKPTYTFKTTLQNKTTSRTIKNTNELLATSQASYKIIASKTGYTEEAGTVLVMLIESKIDKKQYLIITMGGKDYSKRFEEPSKIAEWASKGKALVAKK